jgi:acetyltransferase-like isoleucine patch superfamily enzyme
MLLKFKFILQLIRVLIRKLIRFRVFFLTFIYCKLARLPFNKNWEIYGRLHIHRPNLFHQKPIIKIGQYFISQGKFTRNSFGLIQPNFFHLSPGAKLIIGDNVGISGSTIKVENEVNIGNNVLIGSGCIISDSDAHPINPSERFDHLKTKSKPITIEDDVFIGARVIVLKGVTIGKGSVIGAGSVVSKSIPSLTVAAGNPARIIKYLNTNT